MINLSKENKNEIIRSIQSYFSNERAEDIGIIAAENLFDHIATEIGPYYYNQGIKDAQEMAEQKMLSLEEDILSLERPVMKKKY